MKASRGRWRVIDHTADTGLLVQAGTVEEALAAAGRGMGSILCNRRRVRTRRRITFHVVGETYADLLINFLRELLLCHERESFVFRDCGTSAIERTSTGEYRASAWADGEPWDDSRHEIHTEIKAVTFHQLRLEPRAGGWEGQVIFDL